MNFDYKKYSLEKLENWVHDTVSGEASPQEIYDIIKGVVDEQYQYHKHHTGRCYELLALLNGNGKGHIPAYDEYVEKKENLVCDKEDSSPECKKSWNDFWEEHYYPEEAKDNGMRPWGNSDLEYLASVEKDKSHNNPPTKLTYEDAIAAGWKMTDDGFWIPPQKEDKVVKWELPVEVDGPSGEYFVCFPDDLLEAANLKEGDMVEWIEDKPGVYIFRKVKTTK
jgi:hypothetical protein